jgi:hypothetical protein
MQTAKNFNKVSLQTDDTMLIHCTSNMADTVHFRMYRVSINSFPDYKHLLQENYVE